MIITTTLLTSCVKLLLVPAYRSTDFEVHRNWLAITHSLPISKWYFENTSKWTLDYPPLFAWFEYILSFAAQFFDDEMLNVNHINYSSDGTVLFQRLSVILTDLVYAFGVYKCCLSLQKSWRKDVVLPILLITNCGLIMVDHIHFQYNGIMYGILLLSIAYMLQGKHLLSAFWFTVLLNMKHIYIYLGPPYFIYLLRHYCLKGPLTTKNIISRETIKNVFYLGSLVISVFIITYFPFMDHIPQVLSRLFPFKRGLCHAYWAPNFWAVYNTIDKIMFAAGKISGVQVGNSSTASMTGGLVQEFSHSILPSIPPLVTLLLTALFMIPAMVKLFFLNKQATNFIRCMVVCGLTSFLFGWHVHEKAILMTIIPLRLSRDVMENIAEQFKNSSYSHYPSGRQGKLNETQQTLIFLWFMGHQTALFRYVAYRLILKSILSIMESTDARIFLILSTVGHYSLFPLLYPSSLLCVKVLLLLLYSFYAFHSFYKIYPLSICSYSLPLLNPLESVYLLGLAAVFLFENVIHNLLGFKDQLPFLPLMFTSAYCSVGVIYSWISYYIYFLKYNGIHVRTKMNKNNKLE